ncbi:MAG TPA: pyridoxamine 5'-phosphate oxidase family protein [Actinomycetales bacterium]|jgi:nitroimidazol reductase NimA-like FMN-containing flavoprotein (pyridoxamine 5'-phosphate oxidase superfamily)|nr:pyridoxamine 5'-phosphate oxidase family protein [Actinomycetales bacterium]
MVLSEKQSREALTRAEVGRVVFTDRALPAVLPVTYIVDDDTIVIRTARGSRLARAADGAVLAFETDDLNRATRSGWSVVVTGEAYVETDPDEQARLAELLEPWVPGMKAVFIRIPLTVVTGREVVGAAGVAQISHARHRVGVVNHGS